MTHTTLPGNVFNPLCEARARLSFPSPAPRPPQALGEGEGLTASVLGALHPRERDGPFPAALAEAQQERPRLLVLEQRALPLLADKAHDTPAGGKRSERHSELQPCFHVSLQTKSITET